MSEKVIGYLLLAAGFIFILFAAFSVYEVFTKKSEPVELFHFSGISINMGSLMGNGDGLTAEQQAALEKQKSQIKPQEIISADIINQSSNIAAHMFLMGFIASIGYKISSLGILLLRPINVKVKDNSMVKSA